MFTSVSLLIGIILILGALALFFMDRLRPAYARESDKVYAILIFVAGIMTVPDVDMGLGHAFTLMILGGVTTSIVIDNLRLRGPNSEDTSSGNNRRDSRPPRPRYEERPPVQRGYRAELDNQGFDNRGPALRDRPAPRMNPAQAPGYQGAYANNGQVRPPYEEYRGPAGRLQPSRSGNAGAPPDNRYTDNDRYGDRPPVPQRPPQNQRPPQRESQRESQRPYDGSSGRPSAPSGEGANNQPDARVPDARAGERPPGRPRSEGGPREGSREGQSAMGNSLNNGAENSLRNDAENGQSDGNGAGNSPSSARALNIRPLSEAPKFDDDYRAGSSPEGAPSY